MVSLNPEYRPLPSESGHWYWPDGRPCYTVTAKKTGQPRNTNLTDARTLGLYPSVTTVQKIVYSWALENHRQEKLLEAAFRVTNTGIKFEEWRNGVVEEYELEIDKPPATGSSFHAAIESDDPPPEWAEHCKLVKASLKQFGVDLNEGNREHSFAHPLGFGGKVDWHTWGRFMGDADEPKVIDFKTKAAVIPGKNYAYDNHAMQLAAYREGLNMPSARCLNVFVGVEIPVVTIHEWPEQDLQRGWRMFKLILEFWQEQNKYKP